MNRLTTITLLAISGFLAGCSDMPMRNMSTSGGMTSSGNMGAVSASSWYNGRQDISRAIYFGE